MAHHLAEDMRCEASVGQRRSSESGFNGLMQKCETTVGQGRSIESGINGLIQRNLKLQCVSNKVMSFYALELCFFDINLFTFHRSIAMLLTGAIPDSKVHGANMGPTWVLLAPGGTHVGPMNLAIRDHSHNPRYCFQGPQLSGTWGVRALWLNKIINYCVSKSPAIRLFIQQFVQANRK